MVAVQASDPRAALRVLQTAPAARHAALFGDTVHVALASRAADLPVILAALADAGVHVTETHDLEPSLEDVFIQRVSETVRDAAVPA